MKKKITWKEAKAALHGLQTPPPADRDVFWAAFREKAGEIPQSESVVESPLSRYRFKIAYSLALPVAALIVLGIWLGPRWTARVPERPPTVAAANPPLVQSAENQVKFVRVIADHTGVVIMNGMEHRGTVLWIAGVTLPSSVDSD